MTVHHGPQLMDTMLAAFLAKNENRLGQLELWIPYLLSPLYICVNPSIHSLTLIFIRVEGGLEPIPVTIGQEVRYTDRLHSHSHLWAI